MQICKVCKLAAKSAFSCNFEKGLLFDYKNGRYEKIRIFLAKRDVPPVAHPSLGQ